MKPTFNSYVARRVLGDLGSDLQVSAYGFPAEKRPMPSVTVDSQHFRKQWLAHNLVRKSSFGAPEDVSLRRRRAYRKFLESEAKCKAVSFASGGAHDKISARVVLRAQQIMGDILGVHEGQWLDLCEFTAGASSSRNRKAAHPALKYDISIVPDVTSLALPYLLAYVAQAPEAHVCALMYPGALSISDGYDPNVPHRPFYRVVPGGILNVVDKDYETGRVIIAEPDWNMFLQKGVGNYIRQRLKRFGINLDDQTRNQRLAFAGSLGGLLGTLDLKACSDTISQWCVSTLVSSDWFEVLYALRSPVYRTPNGKWRTMRKMSSMGNGYTFELESAILYALTRAVVDVLKPSENRIGIFGDDIIVASSVCGYLRVVLERFGFTLNTEKSFWGDNPFRESCGKHYHYGVDVTPVHVKHELADNYLTQLINQLARWDCYPYGELTDCIDWLIQQLPQRRRVQCPAFYGDQAGIHFPSEHVRGMRRFRDKRGVDSLRFTVWQPKTTDITARFCDGSLWLLMHMTGYGSDKEHMVTSVTGVASAVQVTIPVQACVL